MKPDSRRIISADPKRLVIHSAKPMEDGSELQHVWVATSGNDPRAWHRPEAAENRSPWKFGRLPTSEVLVPVESIQRIKKRILGRIRAQREWARSDAAEKVQRNRSECARLCFEDQIRRLSRLKKLRSKLDLPPPGPIRSQKIQGAIAMEEGRIMEGFIRRNWGMDEEALPMGCPFGVKYLVDDNIDKELLGYRPADSELRFRRSLIQRWIRLSGLECWLASFPKDALEFVHRHRFKEHRWHLVNLWIRVPQGRELFDEIPALAMALASAPCIRDRPEPNLFRSLRRLVRQKRTNILEWLGFPARKSTLKILARMTPSAITVPSLIGLKRLLVEVRLPPQHLLALEAPISEGLLVAINGPFCPSFRLLNLLARETQGIDRHFLRHLLRDSLQMLCSFPDTEARLWNKMLGRCQSSSRLRELHNGIAKIHRTRMLREDSRVKALIDSGRKLQSPIPGTPSIHPLDTVDAIIREAIDMHHCLASFIDRIIDGYYYAYSVRHNGETATLGIVRHAGLVPYNYYVAPVIRARDWHIDQISGPENKEVTEELRQYVRDWLKNPSKLVQESKQSEYSKHQEADWKQLELFETA